jgi:hypothetical protein
MAVLALVAVAPASAASGKGTNASVQGATAPGVPYRYVAVSPKGPLRFGPRRPGARDPHAITVVGQVEKDGGRLRRWWYLPGSYSIPAAAYDDPVGGLAARGGTLVLSRFSWIYPPRNSGLAILDTRLHLRHPGNRGKPRHAIRRLSLPGSFSFDAVSPDGSTVYLIEHLTPVYGGPYRVRALDARSGKLLPEPIIDPAEPWERMQGDPLSRVYSPDGRWAYTLYTGHERGHWDRAHDAFIHALDTVAGRAVCVELPQLEGRPTSFLLTLRANGDDGQLRVVDRDRALLTVDTRSFEVGRPEPVADASSLGLPWTALGVLAIGLPLGLALGRRRHGGAHAAKGS